ncbi:RhsIA family immunity protein [bacterium]|nr:RhsIA family immunity protein [bacterium]
MRGPDSAELANYKSHVLVHATQWFGPTPPSLKEPSLRKVFSQPTGPIRYWFKGKPPKTFVDIGILSVRKAEISKTSNCCAPWTLFPNVLLTEWEAANEPATLEKKQFASRRAATKARKKLLVHLESKDNFNLDRFLSLRKAKGEREPEDVLKGFVAAMHQWEKECNRLDKKYDHEVPSEFMVNALKMVFGEFCTPKERKHGRHGSYSTPPEYSPRTEKIVKVRTCNSRRVEIDTKEGSGFRRNLTYVILKKRQGWLIDSKKSSGKPSIL